MATSYYSTGSVTLTNGSAVVTGNGTGWQLALISGGNVIVQAPGNVLPIASVDSDTQITAELEWTGASGTYSYTIQRDTAYLQSLDQNSQNLSYLLSELRAGTIFKYDQSGDLAGRDLYDARPKNFGYLVTIGVSQPAFYVKASNTDGDWAGPFPYGTGPVGPAPTLGIGTVTTRDPGTGATAGISGSAGSYTLSFGIPAGLTGIAFLGEYNPATAYAMRDAVRFNGSTYIALQATTGNAPPNLPTTSNAYWEVVAAKGLDGTGAGDMVKSTYDPQNLQVDAFVRGNHTGDIPDSVLFADNAAPTKKARFELSGITAGQSHVITLPDRDVNLGAGWELIEDVSFTAVSAYAKTNLGAYEFLRGTLVYSNSVNSQLGLRTSTNNGSTYDSGASDYSFQHISGIGTSLTGGNAIGSAIYIANMMIAGNQNVLSFTMFNFNKAVAFRIIGEAYGADAAAIPNRMSSGGNRSSSVARNAFQLFPAAGGTISGHLILEGIRG